VPRKIRELKAVLRKAGVQLISQEGSHQKWKHPLVPRGISLAGHDGNDAKAYEEKLVKTLLQEIAEATRSKKA
jgi:predicted RNA binding protein YcfA (HicA-like mRNA interferase family)